MKRLNKRAFSLNGIGINASFILILSLASCANARKIAYFSNVSAGSALSSGMVPIPLVQNNDLLSVHVTSLNPEATAVFNTPNIPTTYTAAGTGGNSMQSMGYLVKPDGNIQFPILGDIKASGLTKEQLETNIKQQLVNKKLLIDPIVTIRYLNFRVTVLGEVGKPSVINVPSEKVSLLEALGLAGDLTIYARRDNLLLIREEGGQKVTRRINLNTGELLTSPYYYLKPNDVIYVEPGKTKVEASGRAVLLMPVIISGLTLAIIVADRLLRKQ